MKLKLNYIITKDSDSRKILEVFTQTVMTSEDNDYDTAASFYTEQELLDDGWKFPEVKFVPEVGESYWFIDNVGEIVKTKNDTSSDQYRIAMGNCYESAELAEEALKRVLLAYRG
jgi:hypothetical protein